MDYDTWKTGWYELGYCSDCKHCLQTEQKLDECREFLEEIVAQLSSEKALNISLLEQCLDELCFRLKVEQSKKDLTVQRAPLSLSQNKQKWLELAVSQ